MNFGTILQCLPSDLLALNVSGEMVIVIFYGFAMIGARIAHRVIKYFVREPTTHDAQRLQYYTRRIRKLAVAPNLQRFSSVKC